MKKLFLILCISLLFIISCSAFRTSKETIEYVGNIFEDNFVYIDAQPYYDAIYFTIKNKSAEPINLVWTNCAVIDPEGQSHKVAGEGVKYNEVNNPIRNAIIGANSSLTDFFVLTDSVYWSNVLKTWMIEERFIPEKTEKKCSAVFCLEISGEERYIQLDISYRLK